MIQRSDTPASAQVIPFPARQNASHRLAQAIASLDTALAEQRHALAEWRGALVDLRGAVGSLGTSLQTYSGSLGALRHKVADLHDHAAELAKTSSGG